MKSNSEIQNQKISYLNETMEMIKLETIQGIVVLRFKDNTNSALISLDKVDSSQVIAALELLKLRVCRDYDNQLKNLGKLMENGPREEGH
jgi:hypothetical protein